MTIRTHLNTALNPGLLHEDEIIGHMIDYITLALVELDNSREMTEKVTTMTVSRDQPDNTPTSIKVTNHKARVVLDD